MAKETLKEQFLRFNRQKIIWSEAIEICFIILGVIFILDYFFRFMSIVGFIVCCILWIITRKGINKSKRRNEELEKENAE